MKTDHRASAIRTQLTLEELQQVRWLLGGVLAMLSVWTVIFLELEAAVWLALTTVGVLTVLIRPQWPARIPRWVHRLAFPFVVAFFVGDLWLTNEVLPAMVRLDMLLLFYRGVTYRQRRDDLQVIVLGLFLVVVAGVLTVSLAFAAQILAFTACALALLLTVTLSDPGSTKKTPAETRNSEPETRDLGEARAPAWARHVRWGALLRRVREVTDWRVVALGAGLFVGLMVLSALLFLAIPRFQLENSLFLERFMTRKARTGFSDTIRFNDVTDIQRDNSVALSVDVTNPAKLPAAPYWRMVVLDEYRDGAFRLSAALRRAMFSVEQTRSSLNLTGERERRGLPSEREPVYWTFYLEAGVSRYLPLLGDFEEIRFREAQKFRVAPALGLVALRDDPVTMTAYRVQGMVSQASVPDPGFLNRLLRHRLNDSRTAAGAMLQLNVSAADRTELEKIVTGLGAEPDHLPESVGLFARRAEAWLSERHGYALQSSIPAGSGDPLVRWMNSRSGGHCELFAGSLVLLARAAGVPARVVVGFHGGAWNGYAGNFTVRNANAHAWCELYDIASKSWIREDPTPGATAEAVQNGVAAVQQTDRSWTARFDSLRIFWYRRIVNFDQRTQLQTLDAVKHATLSSGRWLREWLQQTAARLKGWVGSPWSGGRVAMLLILAVMIGGAVWAAARFRTIGWLWLMRAKSGRGDAVRREAGRWLKKMSSVGRRMPNSDGRMPQPERRSRNQECLAVVSELQRLRFGAPKTWGEPGRIFLRARHVWRSARRGRMAAVE